MTLGERAGSPRPAKSRRAAHVTLVVGVARASRGQFFARGRLVAGPRCPKPRTLHALEPLDMGSRVQGKGQFLLSRKEPIMGIVSNLIQRRRDRAELRRLVPINASRAVALIREVARLQERPSGDFVLWIDFNTDCKKVIERSAIQQFSDTFPILAIVPPEGYSYVARLGEATESGVLHV